MIHSPRYTRFNVIVAALVCCLIAVFLFDALAPYVGIARADDAVARRPSDPRDPFDLLVDGCAIIPALCLLRFGLFRLWKWPPYDNSTLSANENSRLLAQAAWDGDLGRIRALLQAGVDIDAEDRRGLSPIHAAVENSQTAALELLLSKGADPDRLNGDGWTPLAHAIELELDTASGRGRPEPELSSLLIRWGADPDALAPGHGAIRQWVQQIGYEKLIRIMNRKE